MKFGIFSDLHLNWYGNRKANEIVKSLNQQANDAGVDFVINAGDTADGGYDLTKFFDRQLIGTVGNHDCWYEGFQSDHALIERDGIRIALTPLWNDCHNDPLVELWFKENMDGNMIPDFSVAKMKYAFNEAKTFIFAQQPDVVVTHNPPSMFSVGPKYVGQDMANKAFIPELGNEIYDSEDIKLWVCGHVHHKHRYSLNNTDIVCNPLGYPKEIYDDPMDYRLEIVTI